MSYRSGMRGRWRRGDTAAANAESPAFAGNQGNYKTRNASNFQAGSTPRGGAAPELKTEPFVRRTPFLPEEDEEMAADDSMNGSANTVDDANLPPWKKKGLTKIPKKIRKKRLNAKLRNLLVPKNAMMVLNEMHHDLSCVTTESTTPTGQLCFVVTIEIDGKHYRGQGQSKAAAKQTACENALKASLLDKLGKQPLKDETDASTEGKRTPPEDDTPWGSLASYALYKLFSEWQSQGYMLPSCSGNTIPKPPVVNQTGPSQPMKKMPEDAAQRNPVQLLNQLRPGIQYMESREGLPPNLTFTIEVNFDNQVFSGTGPNKKEAKKECAKCALMSMGVRYDD